MNGKQYMRARPRTRVKKRGKAEKSENTVFGMVSRHGSPMIKEMKDKLLFPFGNPTYNNMRGWMRREYGANMDKPVWELVTRTSMMGQLNQEADLRDFTEKTITVTDEGDGKVSIAIPKMLPVQDLKAPPRTVKVNLKAFVITSPFTDSTARQNMTLEQYSFEYGEKPVLAKKLTIETRNSMINLRSTSGHIAIVAIALEFETSDTGKGIYNTDTRWLPAAVIAMGRLK
jgi:hypothetical protein